MDNSKSLKHNPKRRHKIVSDSMYAIQGIMENLRKWEDIGWMRVQNVEIFQK